MDIEETKSMTIKYKARQVVLKIKEYSNLIDQEYFGVCLGKCSQIKRSCMFLTLVCIYFQIIKVRYQSIQEILKIQEYSNLIGQEDVRCVCAILRAALKIKISLVPISCYDADLGGQVTFYGDHRSTASICPVKVYLVVVVFIFI